MATTNEKFKQDENLQDALDQVGALASSRRLSEVLARFPGEGRTPLYNFAAGVMAARAAQGGNYVK